MSLLSAISSAFGMPFHIQHTLQQLFPEQPAKVKHSHVTGIAKAKRAASKARRSRK